MSILSRELLLAAAAAPLPRDIVAVPELGGDVIVQGMSGTARDAWEKSLLVGRGKRREINTDNVRAKLAVQCLVDEQGTRLFADSDAEALGNLRVDVLQRIFASSQKLSGVSDEDIDELKKSSETADGNGSPLN